MTDRSGVIKTLCREQGVTIKKLAGLMGWTLHQADARVNGRVELTPDEVRALAPILGLTYGEMKFVLKIGIM